MSLVLIFWFLCFVRAEVERVRCGLLGDGVSGRANVMSDKECRDKNKLLTTSGHQNHGEANNILFSVSPRNGMMSAFRGNQVSSAMFIFRPYPLYARSLSSLLEHSAVHIEHGTKTTSTTEKLFVNVQVQCDCLWLTIAWNSPISDSKFSDNHFLADPVYWKPFHSKKWPQS